MARLHINQLNLESYVKLCTLIGAAVGLVWGVLYLLGILIGMDVLYTLTNAYNPQTFFSALTGLLIPPIAGAFVGMLLGVVTHWPFNWLLQWLGGLWLESELNLKTKTE